MKGLLVTALLAMVFVFFVGWRLDQPTGGRQTLLFNVAKGEGASAIAQSLYDIGLIRSRSYFEFTVWSRGDRSKFIAGTFELSPSMSTRDIERALAGGKPVSNEREVTILEGWTLRDIADYLKKQGVSSPEDFYALAGKPAVVGAAPSLNWAAAFPSLDDRPKSASLEGYLFPDTYRIYPAAGAEGLIRRMLANFEGKLSDRMRAEISRRKLKIYDVVTMASIIEREVRDDGDRAMVSDIFWRRLAMGMPLQADSTVNYVTGGSSASIGYADTKIDSPWNTYKYRGLPAGPIGSPGLSALTAAIFPKSNPYLYFLTDKQGNVHYAGTIEEHNANKARYLK